GKGEREKRQHRAHTPLSLCQPPFLYSSIILRAKNPSCPFAPRLCNPVMPRLPLLCH
uniref:Uncharacterized protein n=1 Tax=Aegilops tauschii subsp. strangulata TaxID=200361 RepID=A0A453BL77_AEGTS